MYRIGIVEKDRAYCRRLVGFLMERHSDSFEIAVVDVHEEESAFCSLESLDLDTISYDALFFGDGVKVDLELLPNQIAVGFITEKEEPDKKYINKYQSLEKIYKHMQQLCEDSKKFRQIENNIYDQTNDDQMDSQDVHIEQELVSGAQFRVETVTQGEEKYRVFSIEGVDIDLLAVRMLASNHIQGLPQTQYHDQKLWFRITGMKSLYEMVQQDNTPEGNQELLKIFGSMVNNALGLEEYMLSPDRLVLDPKEIYLDEVAGEAIMPYIPIKSKERKDIRQSLERVRALCDSLLEGLNATESLNVEVGLTDVNLLTEDEEITVQDNHAQDEILERTSDEDISVEDISIEDITQGSDEKDKEEQSNELPIESREDTEKEASSAGSTDVFENLQKNGDESLKLKDKTGLLNRKRLPYIIRRRTGEKIMIDRNIFKIGKEESYVDYCIKDNPTVSRNHADIVRKTDGFYLVDKGSLNHTFVNGKKLEVNEYRKLQDGCLLQLADEVFEFVAGR